MASAAPTRDPATDQPPRTRRWIPVSLRIFLVVLVLLTAVSAFFWWRAYVVAQLESGVARDLAAHKWSVHYDYEEFVYGYDPALPPWPRPWYHWVLPDGGRPRIVYVSLPATLSASSRVEL